MATANSSFVLFPKGLSALHNLLQLAAARAPRATCTSNVKSNSQSSFITMIKFLNLHQVCLWSFLLRCELKINSEW